MTVKRRRVLRGMATASVTGLAATAGCLGGSGGTSDGEEDGAATGTEPQMESTPTDQVAGDTSGQVPEPMVGAVEAYLTALVNDDWEGMAAVSTGAAADYAGYLAGLQSSGTRLSQKELQVTQPPTSAESTTGGVILDGAWTVRYLPNTERTFATFTVVEQTDGYLVSDFERDGTPISAEVAGGDGDPVGKNDTTVSLQYVAWTGEGSTMIVILHIRNDRDTEIDLDPHYTTFTSAATEQAYSVDQVQGDETPPGAESAAAAAFGDVTDASQGGTLAVTLTEFPSLENWELELTVPALEG